MGAVEIRRGAIFALQLVTMQCADSDAVLMSGRGEPSTMSPRAAGKPRPLGLNFGPVRNTALEAEVAVWTIV